MPSPEPLLARPLSARSLVASLLLRSRPARMRGARLVQWCGLFGISGGTTRTALSRMVERGELRTHDGVYELAGRVQGRRGSQDWSLDPVLGSWDGSWRVAIVASGSRSATARSELRDALRRMRFGAVREGVWTRPHNLPRESAPAEAWRTADAQCSWWSGRPDGDPVTLAATLFASGAWVQRAVALELHIAHVTTALADTPEAALAGAFVAGAAALAHVRSDPLLPDELGAGASAGASLRRAYGAYEDEFSKALRTWFLGR